MSHRHLPTTAIVQQFVQPASRNKKCAQLRDQEEAALTCAPTECMGQSNAQKRSMCKEMGGRKGTTEGHKQNATGGDKTPKQRQGPGKTKATERKNAYRTVKQQRQTGHDRVTQPLRTSRVAPRDFVTALKQSLRRHLL